MPPPHSCIELRGVRVRNLKNLDLDIPLGRLIAITGVSGAGKSSLAFDTLFAEGRRRYLETLSTTARALLDPLERPEVDSIGWIPPAISVRQRFAETSARPTVATASELHPLLRLYFARRARLVCPACQFLVLPHSPPDAAAQIGSRPPATRVQIAFELISAATRHEVSADELIHRLDRCREAGFVRAITADRSWGTSDLIEALRQPTVPGGAVWIVVDRVTAGTPLPRLTESFEVACRYGRGSSLTLCQIGEGEPPPNSATLYATPGARSVSLDGRSWLLEQWSEELRCPGCKTRFDPPDPALFSFNQPRGACPRCRGLGVTKSATAKLTGGKSQGAEAPGGEVRGGERDCPACLGVRLRPESLCWQLEQASLADWLRRPVDQWLADWPRATAVGSDTSSDLRVARGVQRRLELLSELGLGYLPLDRPLRSLSAGEAQRVRLAGAFATELVHLLIVLDEPTAGLHPRDTQRLLRLLRQLRDCSDTASADTGSASPIGENTIGGNTIVVVEHDPHLIAGCDHVIDLGPGAGELGGNLLFQGTPDELRKPRDLATAVHFRRTLSGESKRPGTGTRRQPAGWLEFNSLSAHNLDRLSVRIPLGVLCVVTGVSGSGKSTLVNDCVFGLVEQALGPGSGRSLPPGEVANWQLLRDVQRIDPAPLSRLARGTPAAFLQLAGPIRELFAGTTEAQVRNFGPGHFGLHAGGPGCCPDCGGRGVIEVDMQFLPDLETRCGTCGGQRFRPEVLEVKYRGMNIAEVLGLSAREALRFFRGQTRVQRKLKLVLDVGLEGLILGQPAAGLSAGETQRLRLAECLSRIRKGNCLMVLDEPTRGLHPADVERLLKGFAQVLAAGHTLLIAEHHPDVVAAADWEIELGPGGGPAGGHVVRQGPPVD